MLLREQRPLFLGHWQSHLTTGQASQKAWTYFLYLMAIVVSTGFAGSLFFRSDPFLLILVIISGYEAFAGYRIIKLREGSPEIIDVIVPFVALGTALLFLWRLSYSASLMSSPVIMSTMISLSLVTVYDIVKYFFIHRFIKTWWLYEHIYKMIGGFSAILSAFTATVITIGKPYTQLGPSVACIGMILYFIWRRSRKTRLIQQSTQYLSQ